MNVNMVEHQRSILAVLGIDLWMPKTDVHARTYTSSLYRDQAASEVVSNQNFNIDTTSLAKQEQQSAQIIPQNEVSLLLKKVEQPVVEYVETPVPIAPEVAEIENIQPIYIEPFYLQAFAFEQCVIVLDGLDLTSEQNDLWLNIQAALSGQYHELRWPFALPQLQDGRGAHTYIQGFLDAMSIEKNVVSLGQLPHYQNDKIIQLASLQEMIDDPQLKRKLWEYMKN